jgi:hypothetical protein
VTPPADGIQDYILTAIKPDGIVTQQISNVTAKDTWKAYTKDAPWLCFASVGNGQRGG